MYETKTIIQFFGAQNLPNRVTLCDISRRLSFLSLEASFWLKREVHSTRLIIAHTQLTCGVLAQK